MHLFLDSSQFIQVGLLDADFNWVHREIIENRKGSQLIHSVVYEMMEEANAKTKEIDGIFLANGPGSYTGIRVAEGMGQVFEIEGIPVCSLYHFEVPFFCEIKNYSFFSEAFKGEVFHYRREGEKSSHQLIPKEDFLLLMEKKERSTLLGDCFSLEANLLGREMRGIYQLYEKQSPDIFTKAMERKEHLPPFYYRSAEKEFKIPQK